MDVWRCGGECVWMCGCVEVNVWMCGGECVCVCVCGSVEVNVCVCVDVWR